MNDSSTDRVTREFVALPSATRSPGGGLAAIPAKASTTGPWATSLVRH